MQNLDKRLRLLETWMQPTGCLECECERLNAAVSIDADRAQACTHRRGLSLLDALRGLNSMEVRHAKP
jgi:hypothetical protein